MGKNSCPAGRRFSIRARGFTLIELLVVVSIIAMLLPALDRARGEAQSIVCLGLYKQFGLALRLYGDDNNDEFSVFHPQSPHNNGKGCWFRTIMPYIDEDARDPTGVLDFQFTKLFACPSGQAWVGVNYGNQRHPTAYLPAVARTPIVYGMAGAIKYSEVNYPSTWMTTFDTSRPYQFQYSYSGAGLAP